MRFSIHIREGGCAFIRSPSSCSDSVNSTNGCSRRPSARTIDRKIVDISESGSGGEIARGRDHVDAASNILARTDGEAAPREIEMISTATSLDGICRGGEFILRDVLPIEKGFITSVTWIDVETDEITRSRGDA